jgi:hypothetical protein
MAVISIGTITIGIEAQGDPKSRMKATLSHFGSIGCDIIICTCRTKGETLQNVLDLNNLYGYEIIWTTNYRSSTKNQVYLNNLSANHIFELFQDIVARRV